MNNRPIKFNNQKLNILYRDDSDESVIDEIFVDRLYRRLDEIIPDLINPIIDVGAHIGLFSLYARILNQTAVIYALEPEANNFDLLKQNLKLNSQTNIIARQLALHWLPDKTTPLFLSSNNHNHSTYQKNDHPVNVSAIELQKFVDTNNIDRIGLIKLDVEGAELNLLPSWSDQLWNKINWIVLEYHTNSSRRKAELQDLIRSKKFSLEHFPSPFDHRFGLLIGKRKK